MKTDVDNMLHIALDVGMGLLEYGADVTRVEDTVVRICRCQGYEVDVFCISSLLQASVVRGDGSTCTLIRRIKRNGYNLTRLELFNAISRDICSGALGLEQARMRIDEANKYPGYHPFFYYLAALVGATSFCAFFGGDIYDVLAVALVSVPVMFLDLKVLRRGKMMVNTIVKAFVGGMLSNVIFMLGLGTNIDYICIGVIMLMIPGIRFGNSIQDFLNEDVLAGMAKFIQALLMTIMIVLGFSLSTLVMGRIWL